MLPFFRFPNTSLIMEVAKLISDLVRFLRREESLSKSGNVSMGTTFFNKLSIGISKTTDKL